MRPDARCPDQADCSPSRSKQNRQLCAVAQPVKEMAPQLRPQAMPHAATGNRSPAMGPARAQVAKVTAPPEALELRPELNGGTISGYRILTK